MKRLIKKLMSKTGYKIIADPKYPKWYEKLLPFGNYAPWQLDAEFMKTYEIIKDNTLVDIYRCYEIRELLENTQKIKWDILEVGVWKWWTWGLIAKKLELLKSDKKIYLADTFTWVVKAWQKDSKYIWWEHADTSIDTVLDLLDNKLWVKNYEILTWIFPDDTWSKIENNTISLCHVDVDVYQSTKEIVERVRPRLSIWWCIVYDDYGLDNCDWVTKFVDERKQRDDIISVYNLNSHAVQIKFK